MITAHRYSLAPFFALLSATGAGCLPSSSGSGDGGDGVNGNDTRNGAQGGTTSTQVNPLRPITDEGNPEGGTANGLNPLGPGRTELIYNFYFADTSDAARPAQEDTIARNIAVVEEDFSICIETQKNYASGGYAPGPLSPRHEQGVAWFQDRVRAALEVD